MTTGFSRKPVALSSSPSASSAVSAAAIPRTIRRQRRDIILPPAAGELQRAIEIGLNLLPGVLPERAHFHCRTYLTRMRRGQCDSIVLPEALWVSWDT